MKPSTLGLLNAIPRSHRTTSPVLDALFALAVGAVLLLAMRKR